MLLEDLSFFLYVVWMKMINYSRPIFSVFLSGGVGGGDPLAPTLGNSWRTTNDILNYWSSMLANIDHVKLWDISWIRLSLSVSRMTNMRQLQV